MSSAEQLPTIDTSLEIKLLELINSWHQDLKTILPGLSDDIQTGFDNNYLMPYHATGGGTLTPHLIKLAYNPQFNAPEAEKIAELKATYFHENYHALRGYSFETTSADQSAIGIAVEEGLATKFEMLHAGSYPGYAVLENSVIMRQWLDEVRALPNGFDYDWHKYKFFDAETGRKWILYKVGLFIVEDAIRYSPNQAFETLNNLTVPQIIKLSRL